MLNQRLWWDPLQRIQNHMHMIYAQFMV